MIKSLIFILLTFMFATELEIDGNLKVTGNIIFSDSTTQTTAPTFLPNFNKLEYIEISTVWIVPAGISSAFVEVWGAGGAGGCRYEGVGSAGGGGSGGYVRGVIMLSPGEAINITVGQGGDYSCENDGEDGTATSFINQNGVTLISATGGYGGSYNGSAGSGGSFFINDTLASGFGMSGISGSSGSNVGIEALGAIPREGTIYGCGGGGKSPYNSNNSSGAGSGGNGGCLILMY